MAFTYCTECGKKFDDQSENCPYCGTRRAGAAADNGFFHGAYGGQNGQGQNGGDRNGQDPYGQGQTGGDQNGQNPYSQGQNGGDRNGQDPYGQNPYGQNQYGQNQYGQNQYGQNQYGQSPYGQNPYGHRPYWQSPYGQNPYGQNPYGQNPYGQDQYGRGGSTRPVNVLTLVLAIVNLVLACSCVGVAFGIAGIMFTMTAKNAATDEEAKKNEKIALVIGIVGIVLSVLLYVAMGIFMLLAPDETETVAFLVSRFIRK